MVGSKLSQQDYGKLLSKQIQSEAVPIKISANASIQHQVIVDFIVFVCSLFASSN